MRSRVNLEFSEYRRNKLPLSDGVPPTILLEELNALTPHSLLSGDGNLVKAPFLLLGLLVVVVG